MPDTQGRIWGAAVAASPVHVLVFSRRPRRPHGSRLRRSLVTRPHTAEVPLLRLPEAQALDLGEHGHRVHGRPRPGGRGSRRRRLRGRQGAQVSAKGMVDNSLHGVQHLRPTPSPDLFGGTSYLFCIWHAKPEPGHFRCFMTIYPHIPLCYGWGPPTGHPFN